MKYNPDWISLYFMGWILIVLIPIWLPVYLAIRIKENVFGDVK